MDQQTEIDVPEALGALAHEIMKLDRRTVELAESHKALTDSLEATADALTRIMAHHTIAFRRISELMVSLGADIQGPELAELRRLFDLRSPEVN